MCSSDLGGAPGMGTGAARPGRPASSPSNAPEDDSTSDDPTLKRLKTSESLGAGSMTRDEGQLTAKVLRREKVSNVDTKQLQSTHSDSMFQGSLLQSSVPSIRDVAKKANAEPQVKEEGEARFKARQLMLAPSTEEHPKTPESSHVKSESSPSPSPSASASVKPSSR